MTLDAHVTGIWCGQIRGGVGNSYDFYLAAVTCRISGMGLRLVMCTWGLGV